MIRDDPDMDIAAYMSEGLSGDKVLKAAHGEVGRVVARDV